MGPSGARLKRPLACYQIAGSATRTRRLTQCSMPEKLRSASETMCPVFRWKSDFLRSEGRRSRHTQVFVHMQIDILCVEIEVHGFQCRETASGAISIRAPQFRSGDCRWLPALILPDSVMSAIGDAFVEEIGRPELAGKGKVALD